MSGYYDKSRAAVSAKMDKASSRAKRRHASLRVDFARALRERLDRTTWAVGIADVAVEIGDDVRFPDVVVERFLDGSLPLTAEPVVIFEVLSPSSVWRDMHESLVDYSGLPSLEAYIVASPTEPIIWVWQRDPAARVLPELPVEIQGADRSAMIDALAISMPLFEIYGTLCRSRTCAEVIFIV